MDPVEPPHETVLVERYLAGLPGGWRRLADGHWGVSVDAAGWRLDVGLAIRRGVLRAQAEALPPDRVDPHELLYRNRQLRLVRYTHAADGTVWVEADLPAESTTEALVDRLLGSVVAAATVIREWAADADAADADAVGA